MELVVAEPSPVNAVAIRESTLGQYLESINTGGTWLSRVQETLGFQPTEFTALDAVYAASGAIGMALLVPLAVATGPVAVLPVVVGSTLVGISAVGLTEEDRRTKIGTGIVAGATAITNPQALVFVAKEAYGAGKETVKQTVELAKSSIGLTTAALGLGTSIVATSVIVVKNRKTNKRKRE